MHKKQILLGFALIVSVVVAAGFFVVPNSETVKKRFEQQASQLLATTVTSQSAQFIFLPQPHVVMSGVTVANHSSFDKVTLKSGFLGFFNQDFSTLPLKVELEGVVHSHHYKARIVLENPVMWKEGQASAIEIALQAKGFDGQFKGQIEGLSAKLEAKEFWWQGYLLKEARFTLTPQSLILHEARGYKGLFSGQITQQGKAVKVHIRAKDIEMLSFLPHLNVSGQAHIDINAALALHDIKLLEAKIHFNMAKGIYHNGNIDETIRDVVRRPLARSSTTLKAGETIFNSAQASLLWRGQWMSDRDILITTTNSRILLQGTSAWNGRHLQLKGFATLLKEKIELPFMVQGVSQEPLLRFDVQQLIQQSKSTAPLRSPARDEDAARAVLDVITRTNPTLAAPDELMKNINQKQ